MNLIQKILGIGGTVQTVPERSAADVSQRLAEVLQAIDSGEGDLVALLEERDQLKRQLQAEAIRQQKRADEAYRAEVNRAREKYIAEVRAEVTELWRVLPYARWVLLGLSRLEKREGVSGFDGRNFDVISGLPLGAVERIGTAIAQELQGTALLQQIDTTGAMDCVPVFEAPRDTTAGTVVDRGRTDLYGVPLHRDRTYYNLG